MLVNAGALDEGPARARPPTAAAWRVYWAMVALELVLLLGGTRLLVAHGHDELTTPWVALVVGLHFLPFARAFGTPLFGRLGLALRFR